MENYIVGWLWKDSSKFISLNKQGFVISLFVIEEQINRFVWNEEISKQFMEFMH